MCLCVWSHHAEWCPGTEGYILSSRRNIALRNDSSQSRCPVLYSNAPTYFCGQTLTFKYEHTHKLWRLQIDLFLQTDWMNVNVTVSTICVRVDLATPDGKLWKEKQTIIVLIKKSLCGQLWSDFMSLRSEGHFDLRLLPGWDVTGVQPQHLLLIPSLPEKCFKLFWTVFIMFKYYLKLYKLLWHIVNLIRSQQKLKMMFFFLCRHFYKRNTADK